MDSRWHVSPRMENDAASEPGSLPRTSESTRRFEHRGHVGGGATPAPVSQCWAGRRRRHFGALTGADSGPMATDSGQQLTLKCLLGLSTGEAPLWLGLRIGRGDRTGGVFLTGSCATTGALWSAQGASEDMNRRMGLV